MKCGAMSPVGAFQERSCHRLPGKARIGELYRIEAELRGLNQEARLAGRQERSAPLFTDIRIWLTHHRACVAGKSPLGEALAYMAKNWNGLCGFLTDDRIEIDNNTVERTIRRLPSIGRMLFSPGTMREPRTGRPSPRP